MPSLYRLHLQLPPARPRLRQAVVAPESALASLSPLGASPLRPPPPRRAAAPPHPQVPSEHAHLAAVQALPLSTRRPVDPAQMRPQLPLLHPHRQTLSHRTSPTVRGRRLWLASQPSCSMQVRHLWRLCRPLAPQGFLPVFCTRRCLSLTRCHSRTEQGLPLPPHMQPRRSLAAHTPALL